MATLDMLSTAASGVFPGSRVLLLATGEVQVVVSDTDGKVIASAQMPMNVSGGANALTETVANCVMQLARQKFYHTPVTHEGTIQ